MYPTAAVGPCLQAGLGENRAGVGCTGNIFVTCWSEWKWGDSKLLLPKTCKVYCRFGGGAMFFVLFLFLV